LQPAQPVQSAPKLTVKSNPMNGTRILFTAWLVGLVIGFLRMALSLKATKRLRSESVPVTDQRVLASLRRMCSRMAIAHPPNIAISQDIIAPVLIGPFRPTILIPDSQFAPTEQSGTIQFDMALAHELAHFRRRDLFWSTFDALIGVLFFFHPLVWLLRRESAQSADAACDAEALAATNFDRQTYARLLLDLADNHAGILPGGFAMLGMIQNFGSLKKRLRNLMNARPISRRAVLISGILITALAVPGLIPMRLVPRAVAEETVPTTLPSTKPEGMVKKVYDIRDLIFPRGSSRDSWSSNPVFAHWPIAMSGWEDLIRQSVTPNVWENGGKLEDFNNNTLVVTAPASTQEALNTFLNDLRSELVQIAIKAVIIPTDVQTLRKYKLVSDKPASDVSALTIGFIISADNVDFQKELKALENERKSELLRPSVVLLSGQPAEIDDFVSIPYVSDYAPTASKNGQVEMLPVVKTTRDGYTFTVRPDLHDGAKLITMDIDLELHRFLGFEDAPAKGNKNLRVQVAKEQMIAGIQSRLTAKLGDQIVFAMVPVPKDGQVSTQPDTTQSAGKSDIFLVVLSANILDPKEIGGGPGGQQRVPATGPATQSSKPPSISSDPTQPQSPQQEASMVLVTRALDAETKKDLTSALSLYQQAVEADPSNEIAVAGRDRMRAALGLLPVGKDASGLQGTATQIALEHDSIQTRFNLATNNARKALASKDYQTAQVQIANAAGEIDEDPAVFSKKEIAAMKAIVDALNIELQDGEPALPVPRYSDPVILPDKPTTRRTPQLDIRERAILSLIQVAQTYQQQKDYVGMLGVLDQILALDPKNDYAVQMRPTIQEQADTQEQKKRRLQFDKNYVAAATQPSAPNTEDQALQEKLDRELPKIQFDATALSEILGGGGGATSHGFLSDVTGANIIVNWDALAKVNVDKTSKITLSLSNVKFRKVLQLILDQAAGGVGKLAFVVKDGIIVISTVEDLGKQSSTKPADGPATKSSDTPRVDVEKANREHEIAALITVAKTDQEQRDYVGMLGVLDQILALDPKNDYAVQMRPFIQQGENMRPDKMQQLLSLNINPASTQNSDLSKEDRTAQAQLERELPNVQFDAVPLADVISSLQDAGGVEILVNWAALKTVNIDKKTPVTISSSGGKFGKVLHLVLDQVAGGLDKLDFTVSDGIVEITTEEDLASVTITIVHDLRGLLVQPVPGEDKDKAASQISGQIDRLEKHIEATISPQTWKTNNPKASGNIDDWNESLIITQTPKVQQDVNALLKKLSDDATVKPADAATTQPSGESGKGK
jgi:beta-lactamase regulating signal transducer with metallopeptidase domain/tetratricopeptide (TPR) repeat protein